MVYSSLFSFSAFQLFSFSAFELCGFCFALFVFFVQRLFNSVSLYGWLWRAVST